MAIPASHRLAVLHPSGSNRSAVASPPEVVVRPSGGAGARDSSAALAASYKDGEAAGRKAAEAAFELKRELVEASHREEIGRLVEGAASALANKFEQAIAELRGSLADQMADLVRPFVEKSIRAEALDAVMAELRGIVDGATTATVLVQGPRDLLASIGAAFEGQGHNLKLEPSSGTEVRVTVDRTLVETRIAEWLQLIEAAQ